MNFKKTLGLVLTAVVVSTSLAAVKPVKAASSAPTNFSYFFTKNSLVVDGEKGNSYVVDTDYAGKVQYELWVKKVSDPNSQWEVISVNGSGKVGYTDAVESNNKPYVIPVKSDFSFSEGQYMVGVYAKVADKAGAKTYGWHINANGYGVQGSKDGAETYDAVKTTPLNVLSNKAKDKYNEMLGNFLFDSNSSTTFIKGQTYTFKGFASQKDGAKYKLVVRKYGDAANKQQILNDKYAATVQWKPDTAGTYQLIAWSAPDVNKGAARDGWATETVTVIDGQAATVSSVDDIALTAKQNDTTFALPKTVKAKLSDGTTVDANVAWDTAVDVSKAGTVNITGKLTDYNNYAVKGTVTVAAPLTYVDGSLNEKNIGLTSTVDFKVSDLSLISEVWVNGVKTTDYTVSAATNKVILKDITDSPKSIYIVDKDGNKVVVKSEVAPVTTLTYTAGSLNEKNIGLTSSIDFLVNDVSLVSEVWVDGAKAEFTVSAAKNRVIIKNMYESPKAIYVVAKDGSKLAIKGTVDPTPTPDPTPDPTPTSSLKYVDGSLAVKAFNPAMGFLDFKVSDTSLIAKVIVNGQELPVNDDNNVSYILRDSSTVRLTNLLEVPSTIVLVDKNGTNVTVK